MTACYSLHSNIQWTTILWVLSWWVSIENPRTPKGFLMLLKHVSRWAIFSLLRSVSNVIARSSSQSQESQLPNAPLRNVVSSTNNHAVALGSVTSFSLQNTTSQSILRSSFNADTRQQLFSARAGVNDKAELLPSTLNYYWYHPVSSLASMCDFRSFSVHQQFQMDVTYCNHNWYNLTATELLYLLFFGSNFIVKKRRLHCNRS